MLKYTFFLFLPSLEAATGTKEGTEGSWLMAVVTNCWSPGETATFVLEFSKLAIVGFDLFEGLIATNGDFKRLVSNGETAGLADS